MAGVLLQAGSPREALREYQAVLERRSDCPAGVRVGIGICLAALGRTANVCAWCRLTVGPDSV